ncbi:hypothetical protein LEN26_000965 [Aphanomyces euteiches]|nr:hypothetical protein LEN26_000965 [Aphanomyces euteiches]
MSECQSETENAEKRFRCELALRMAKVHEVPTKAAVRLSFLSLCYTGIFVLKLASTPFFAYLTEPLPWSLPHRDITKWTTFEAFNNATYSFLRHIYNDQTMHNAVCKFDSSTVSFVLRSQITLPLSEVPEASSLSHIVRFPGAIFYSGGARQFMASLLGQDSTRRRQMQLFHCQRNYYCGAAFADSCVWLEPLPSRQMDDTYQLYFATIIWENTLSSWLKLGFRCLLMLYILRVVWQDYCCHYRPLLANLRDIGVGNGGYCRYVVVVGDPTFLVLNDPFVSLVMVIDIMLVPGYTPWSVERVSQYDDLPAFFLGVLYSARFVWSGYFVMRCMSSLVKLLGWEKRFAPIDPGVLGFGAFLYGGPTITAMANTSLMYVFHINWDLFLSSKAQLESIEVASGISKLKVNS